MLALLSLAAALAQSVNVNVMPLRDVLPPQVMYYLSNPGQYFNITVQNPSTEAQQIFFGAELRQVTPASGLEVVVPAKTMPRQPIEVGAGATRVLTAAEMRTMFNHVRSSDVSMPSNLFSDVTSGSFGNLPEISVAVSADLKRAVKTFKTLTLTVPSYMRLDLRQCSPSQPDYDAAKGVVTFHNVSSTANIKLRAAVKTLDFQKPATTDNKLRFTPGQNGKDGQVDLNGVLNVGISFDEIDYAQSGGDLYLSANMSMGSITVHEATGKFDPEISLRDLGRTTIGSVPDFLTDGEVSVNLYNPLIDINIQSDIDVAGFVSGTLYAEDANGQEMARVRIPEFYIRPDGSTHVCICKYAEGVDASAYDQVVAVPQLSDIMRRIPKTVRFAAEARADASREGTMELGKSYTIQPAYSIMAPLAFDEGARIVYNDTIDGWTDDLEDIDLMAGSAIELTANVENKIPAYLTVSATAIDVQGKPIPENRIKVEVSNVINASEDGKTPVVTPLKIRLTEGEPGSVALVDGLTFRIEAASGEEGAKSIVGQTINAYNHTLKARDIKVRLDGKIIVNKD